MILNGLKTISATMYFVLILIKTIGGLNMPKRYNLQIPIDENLRNQLKAIAQEHERTIAALVRYWIIQKIKIEVEK